MLDLIKDETSGKLYLKTFLLDKHFNKSDSLDVDAIRKNVQSFVGKPFIHVPRRYYPQLKIDVSAHPPEFDNGKGPLDYYTRSQEKYTIGYVRSVEPDKSVAFASEQQADERWLAMVEITDPIIKTNYEKQGAQAIPHYVSAAVYALDKNVNLPSQITAFEGLHLAAVDIPMSGFDRAVVRGSCVGDLDSCSNKLAQASVTLTELTQEQKAHDAQVLRGIADRYSSYDSRKPNQPLEKLAESTTSVNNSNEAQQPSTTTQAQVQPQVQAQPQVQPTIGTTSDSNGIPFTLATNTTGTGQPFSVKAEQVKPAQGNTPGQIGGSDEKKTESKSEGSNKDEVSELRHQMAEMNKQMTALLEERKNEQARVAENKAVEKRKTIEAAFPADYANSPEERTKAIESLMKFEGPELNYIIEKFVVPTTGVESPCGDGKVKQAGGGGSGGCADKQPGESITKKRSMSNLTDYAKPNTNKVAQASVQVDSNSNNNVPSGMTERILSMTNIVNSSRLSGQWR